mmetsp:Transcript_51543/g.136645  ORF Transcript_51543/g.136645 Transcript_51543/m.136645 type:complete len:488 (+) Transcript_51543:445-1908(+)
MSMSCTWSHGPHSRRHRPQRLARAGRAALSNEAVWAGRAAVLARAPQQPAERVGGPARGSSARITLRRAWARNSAQLRSPSASLLPPGRPQPQRNNSSEGFFAACSAAFALVPMLLLLRYKLVSAPLTFRASAIAVAPEGPISLKLSSNMVSAPLTLISSASTIAPASPIFSSASVSSFILPALSFLIGTAEKTVIDLLASTAAASSSAASPEVLLPRMSRLPLLPSWSSRSDGTAATIEATADGPAPGADRNRVLPMNVTSKRSWSGLRPGTLFALSRPRPKSSPISRPSRTMFDHQASSSHGGVGSAMPSQTERAAKYSWNERCAACTLSGESCSRLRSGIRSCLTRFSSELSAASPSGSSCAAAWRSLSVMARDLRQCTLKKTAWSSARSAALLLPPARASIASIATLYNSTTVDGISNPWRNSKIDATIESISGLDVIFCPVSPSVGTRSLRNGISTDALSMPNRCSSACCCCLSVSGDSWSR